MKSITSCHVRSNEINFPCVEFCSFHFVLMLGKTMPKEVDNDVSVVINNSKIPSKKTNFSGSFT